MYVCMWREETRRGALKERWQTSVQLALCVRAHPVFVTAAWREWVWQLPLFSDFLSLLAPFLWGSNYNQVKYIASFHKNAVSFTIKQYYRTVRSTSIPVSLERLTIYNNNISFLNTVSSVGLMNNAWLHSITHLHTCRLAVYLAIIAGMTSPIQNMSKNDTFMRD